MVYSLHNQPKHSLTPPKNPSPHLFLSSTTKISTTSFHTPGTRTHRYSNEHRQTSKTQLRPKIARLEEGRGRVRYEQNKNPPSNVPKSCEAKNETPSIPTTNPTKLAAIIIIILSTAPKAQTCLDHGLSPNCTHRGRLATEQDRVDDEERKIGAGTRNKRSGTPYRDERTATATINKNIKIKKER